MKKLIAILLAAVMLISLYGCKKEEEPTVSQAQETVEPTPEPEKTAMFSKEEWPVIDGATAFLPFYQEMAAQLLGISTEEAAEYVMCNTTDYAYPNLWQRKADLIFCFEPSQEQISMAQEENGVIFETVPFAREGFVFFVNQDNPVDSITVAQLHDIYAGIITNWKELGGNDEEILAYQRSEGSGSQTGLYKHIISEYEIAEPPTTQRFNSMMQIVDAVAGYENSAGSLGFSYRYFVTNMHYDERVKMLKVDGVYPDYETIENGTYPLISDVCAVFRKDMPEDCAVRKIAQWCTGSEGAALVKASGYVPTAEIDNTPYEPVKKEPKRTDYAKGNPCPACTVMNSGYENNLTQTETSVNVDGQERYCVQISGLKNKEVQDTINKKILDTYTEFCRSEYPPYPGLATRLSLLHEYESWEENPYSCEIAASFNNILCVVMRVMKSIWIDDTDDLINDIDNMWITDFRTLNIDLNTGKEIYIGDLFPDNMDGVAYINEQIAAEGQKPEAFDEPPYSQQYMDDPQIYFRSAFQGIQPNQKYYINENLELCIVLDYENPEIANRFTATTFRIDLHGINAFESRFMGDESLFTDERKSPCLFYRTLDYYPHEEFIPDWSEGRDIRYNYFISDDAALSCPLPEASIVSDANLTRLKNEMEVKYDRYAQENYCQLDGSIYARSDANCCGSMTNLHNTVETFLRYYDVTEGNWHYLDRDSLEEHLCYSSEMDTPITLQELYVPGSDVDGILRNAIKGSKKYSEQMYQKIMANYCGFSIEGNALKIYYKDTSYEGYDEPFIELPYKDLEPDQLVIFD